MAYEEIVIKDNIIAVKTANPFGSTITVEIFTKDQRAAVDLNYLVIGRSVLVRAFEDATVAASIRHTQNWIDKLDRECRATGRTTQYWRECQDVYESHRVGFARVFLGFENSDVNEQHAERMIIQPQTTGPMRPEPQARTPGLGAMDIRRAYLESLRDASWSPIESFGEFVRNLSGGELEEVPF